LKAIFFAPVFNEVERLPLVLEEMHAVMSEEITFLLVNNGSTDGSEVFVRKSGFPYLDLPRNEGVGGAYARALDWALEKRVPIFGAIAANGKMLPAETSRLLEPLVRGEADYVTGSRFLAGGASPNLPPFRRRSIPLVNLFARLLTGARLTDATCGFRAYRLEILRSATFDWHAPALATYGLEYYLYAKVLLDGGWRWTEVPVTMQYPATGPYSKIRAGVDWLAMLEPWIRARVDGRGFGRRP
jgi:dolichol-phosphate mannosyltransferase